VEPHCVCGHSLHEAENFCGCGCSISQEDVAKKSEEEELAEFYRTNAHMGVLNSWGY